MHAAQVLRRRSARIVLMKSEGQPPGSLPGSEGVRCKWPDLQSSGIISPNTQPFRLGWANCWAFGPMTIVQLEVFSQVDFFVCFAVTRVWTQNSGLGRKIIWPDFLSCLIELLCLKHERVTCMRHTAIYGRSRRRRNRPEVYLGERGLTSAFQGRARDGHDWRIVN